MKTAWPLVTALLFLMIAPAAAQTPNGTPVRVRGTVEKLDGRTLHVRSRDGQDVPVLLTQNFSVLGTVKAALSDIKTGDFVGAAAVRGTDGKLHAQEVLIFPEAARGSNEGHYAWDLTPDSTMTNATVTGLATRPEGRMMSLKYKGGENEIDVGPGVPVVTFAPADPTLLKPGAAVFIPAVKQNDGAIAASRVIAEKDGVKPPM